MNPYDTDEPLQFFSVDEEAGDDMADASPTFDAWAIAFAEEFAGLQAGVGYEHQGASDRQ